MGMKFYNNCVNWPRHDVEALTEMVESSRKVTRRTFIRHVDQSELARIEWHLGYRRGELTMAGDYHVRYERGTLRGRRVYFFTHSAIEYVFTETGNA